MVCEVESCAKISFLTLAKKIGGKKPPTPLRRAFSLMRLLGCKTIVFESTDWPNECKYENCEHRFSSCKDYIEKLPLYGYEIKNKKCMRISFFNSDFYDKDQILLQRDSDILGYCILHIDSLISNKGTQKEKLEENGYLTECIINADMKIRGYSFGLKHHKVTINSKNFSISGNYFAQQNQITNCCAHAAIKMAIRGNGHDITCEAINTSLGIDHVNEFGYSGLKPQQFIDSITDLTGFGALAISAHDLESPQQFVKTIYLAVESRYPVILLFSTPDKSEEDFSGHAVTLIGHTFHEHNWWAYGFGGYFVKQKDIEPLSSFLWCDNFIVQDDNLGPYYHLPTRFLTEATGVNGVLTAVENLMSLKIPYIQKELWLKDPITAIIIHPKTHPFPTNQFILEPWIYQKLQDFMGFLKESDALPNDEMFEIFFNYYYRNSNEKVEPSLIMRTVIASREDYLSSIENIIGSDEILSKNILNNYLPEIFWVTEISVPEVFWTNKSKIGEIITDPQKFDANYESSVILIRLPLIIGFIEDEGCITRKIDQTNSHQPLISPFGLST